MEVRFSGICIGGPKDGQHIGGSPSSTLLVAVERPIQPENVPMAEDDAYIFHYRHTHFEFGYQANRSDPPSRHTYGFWVPEGTQEPQRYVLETLAKHYRKS